MVCGCTTSLDYSETASEGAWKASLYPEGKDAFATSFTWDGTEEGLRIEPGEIAGCTITRYGGYFGRGLPEPFFLVIPDANYVNESEIPKDAEVTDLKFTLVVDEKITDIFCADITGFFYREEDGSQKYYKIMIDVELDPDNRYFMMKEGRLYKKKGEALIEGLYYESADSQDQGEPVQDGSNDASDSSREKEGQDS